MSTTGLFRAEAEAVSAHSNDGDDVESVAGPDVGSPVRGDGSSARAPRAGSGAVFRTDQQARVLKGKTRVGVDPRKYRYDVIRGRGIDLPFMVTRDDRMAADEAGDMLHAVHVMWGLEAENENVLLAFDSGLFFCHTVNGGSVLNPARCKFSVPGVTTVFDFAVIRDKFGEALRRFFRAYADDITNVNRKVLREYDPFDEIKKEQHGWLMEVAHKRGLQRFPHLAHDSADACLELSPVERQALQASKALVIGATTNSADRMRPISKIESMDKYDSSVGTTY